MPFLGLYCLGYAGSAFCDVNPQVTSAALLAAALYSWYNLHNCNWSIGLVGIVTAGLGVTTETYLVNTGVMVYDKPGSAHGGPEEMKVALWLPALYFLGAMGWGAVSRRMLEVRNHTQEEDKECKT